MATLNRPTKGRSVHAEERELEGIQKRQNIAKGGHKRIEGHTMSRNKDRQAARNKRSPDNVEE